jgi:hypothetical protein
VVADGYIRYALAVYYRNLSALSTEASSHDFICEWHSPALTGQPCTAILNADNMMEHLRNQHGVEVRSRVCNWGKCHDHEIDGEIKRHLPRHYPMDIKTPRMATVEAVELWGQKFGGFEYQPSPVGRKDMAPRSVASKITRQINIAFGLLKGRTGAKVETKIGGGGKGTKKAMGKGTANAGGRGRKKSGARGF